MLKPEIFYPSSELQKYVLEYGVLNTPQGCKEPFFYPPTGLSGFVFQAGESSKEFRVVVQEKDFSLRLPRVIGQVTEPIHGEILGEVKILIVFFHPLGMYQLFGVDMGPLKNESSSLSLALPPQQYKSLMEHLSASKDTPDLIRILDDFLCSLIPPESGSTKMIRVLDFIHKRKGNVRIPELARVGFYHRKTLERHFRKMVGLAPKEYARIYQFKCLIQLIHSKQDITWSQLAVQAGYYDLSHLSRYVHDYLQVAPNSIVKLEMDLIYYLLDK